MEGTRPSRPLLTVSARRRTGVLLASCAVLAAVLGVLFAHQSRADGFDHSVDAPVITGSRAIKLWPCGSPSPAPRFRPSCSVVVIAVVGWLRGAVLAILAVPVAVGLCQVLIKPLVHRA
jgi:hypothetical protein